MVVLRGTNFTASGPIGNFCPILEEVPSVDNEICARGFPLGVETIGEFETDGEL